MAPTRIRRDTPDPIPTILIARLAVDISEQGKGLGAALLQEALIRGVTASLVVGAKAVTVQAFDAEAGSFYAHFGFQSSAQDPLHMFLSIKDAVHNAPPDDPA